MKQNSKAYKGWVYIYTNPSLNGLVKIGFTAKTPQLRVKEQDQAGLPYSHELVYEALVFDAQRVEQRVHKALKDNNENKEWFNCTVSEAIKKIREIAGDSLLLEEVGCEYFEAEGCYENIDISNSKLCQSEPIKAKVESIYSFCEGGVEKNLNFSVQRVEQTCSNCRKSYSLTLTRYENQSICPHCRNLDSMNIFWE